MNNRLKQELEAVLELQTGDTFTADHIHTLVNGIFAADEGGEFKYVEYDSNAFPDPKIGDTTLRIAGLGYADESMLKTVFIMPNKETNPDATMMIVVDEVDPPTDPKTYQYIYVGNINDLNLLTEEDIVNDLTTGGTDRPLSAEQGKVLKGITTAMSFTTCDSEASEPVKTISIPGYLDYVNGGSIKIRFSHENTSTDQVKLKINDLAAKPIYYNNLEVTENNTWKDDEVVEVYYDGTNFNCLQLGGGSGSGNGFYNLNNEHPLEEGNTYTLELAVETVANDTRVSDEQKNGMIITFWDDSEWKTYRYSLVYDPESPSAETDFANVDNWKEFESGGGGGGSENGRIVLQRITQNFITKVGDPVNLQFYFDHVDSEGQSTGNNGTATITVLRGGIITSSFTRTISKGTINLDMTDKCGIGINNIRIVVIVDTGLVQQSAALAWSIQEVKLDLTSTLTGHTILNQGDNLQVTYTLESGSVENKSVVCYVDGVQYNTQSQTASISNGVFNIDTTGMTHGQHTIQLRASQRTGQVDEHGQELLLYSNLIYSVIGVKTTSGSTPFAMALFDIPDGSTVFGAADVLTFNVNQYDLIKVKFSAWSTLMPVAIEVMDGQNVLHSSSNYGTEEGFDIRVLTSGSHAYSIIVDETPKIAFNVTATETELGVEVPNGRTLYLDAVEHGHSNSDINRNTWTNTEGDIETTTTFTDFTWTGDGWINNALRLKGSARATINYKPLQRNTSGGMAVGFKFKVSEISDEYDGEKLISCIDNTNTGFYITANGVYIVQNNTILTQMLIAEDTVYDVEFVAWPEVGTGSDAQKNAHFVYIYIDGIISGGYRIQTSGSSIFQNIPSNINLGVSTATLDLYRVWGYRRALNDNESLNCYILDQDDNIDLLFKKRDNNNILNAQGGVTPDSLPDGTRIMIITGTAIGTAEYGEEASVLAAAHRNKKSDYFPCTEISSYIKGATDRSKNFIAHNNGSDIVEGQDLSLKLRLQGTSSLAYPVKNYRIYTKKSTMYVGNNPESVFGETGELVSGGKFAMHDTSAPVAVWCLKADYAESSSSHNTGMACMVNDTLKHTNIKTPAQRDVDTTQYPYEVRTTVDGEPCILFYRETLNDAPIFLGKFNFNNDKSTEAVYGFTGIKGYHNVAPLNNEDNNETEFVAQQYKTRTGTSLGVDLTECWEFRNNEDPMGSFLDDDFVSTRVDPDSGDTIPKWTGTFEARYPDEDDLNDQFASGNIVPHYLSTLVSWVKSTGVLSTDTEEQAATKLTKFRNELSLYFDVEHLCSYFVFTQVMACLDQMVKNMMMAFWYDKNADSSSPMGKVRAYMIFYDNDTILGVINNGRLLAPYNVTRQTIQRYDGGNPVYFYAGHESVLWNNLATQFPTEIRNAYVKLRGYMTNTRIFQYFDVQQTDKFCERIYNLDALNKYIAPTGMSENQVAPYRDLMQGNRKSHRHFFVNKRMSIFDNEWRAGEYYSAANEISYKGISAAGSAIGFTLKQAGNVEVQSDVSDDFVKNYVVSGNTPTTIGKLTPSAVGTIFHIYGMRQLTSLNLAAWDFDQLNLGNFPYLEEFVFGAKRAIITGHDWRNSGGYITTNGKQWINTGIGTGQNIKILIDCQVIQQTDEWLGIMGARGTGTSWDTYFRGNNEISFYSRKNNNIYSLQYLFASRIYSFFIDYNLGDRLVLELSKDYAKINGTSYTTYIGTNTQSVSNIGVGTVTVLGEYDNTPTDLNELRIFSAQVFNNDVLVREMYPAIDLNGVACMYDYVSGQFFYNQGTGEFTVSDEVRNVGIGFVEKDNPFTKPYYNSGLILGDSMPRLKRFIAQNLTALPSADLSGCQMIEEIDLEGSKAISSVNIPVGAPLTKYKLPTVGMRSDWRNSGGWIKNEPLSSYLDLLYKANSKTNFRIKVSDFELVPNNYLFYSAKAYNQERFWLGKDLTNWVFGWGTTSANPTIFTDDSEMGQLDIKTLEFIDGKLSLNGVQKASFSGTWNSSNNLYFFGGNNNGSLVRSEGTVKVYSIEIWEERMMREMYPAIDQNGVACMYDYVTEQFFYNQGTGEFTISNEVTNAAAAIYDFTPYQLSLVGLPNLKTTQDWKNNNSYLISNCLIKTDVLPSTDIEGEICFYHNGNPSAWYNLIGNGGVTRAKNQRFLIYNNQIRKVWGDWPGTDGTVVTSISEGWHTFHFKAGNSMILDGVYVGSLSTLSAAPSTPLCVTGWISDEDSNAPLYIYDQGSYPIMVKYVKFWTNNQLKCEAYPAIDYYGQYCVYDYVTERFLYKNLSPSNRTLICSDGVYNGLTIGVPSKIQSLTFRDCPLINGFNLLKTIAGANNTSLNTVNVNLPSAISGPIADLMTITNLWNSNTGENSNLKIYGSYTVTDGSLTTAQCAAIGYNLNGAATQMSSKIYGLMVTIDQSTILQITLQSYNPNGEGYNQAASIILHTSGYGTLVNSNDPTQGWYLTRQQASAITSVGIIFKNQVTVTDTYGITGTVGSSYDLTDLTQLSNFGINTLSAESFQGCTKLKSIVIPSTFNSNIPISLFQGCTDLWNVRFLSTTGISSIGANAFNGCSSLSTLQLPSTTSSIGGNAFESSGISSFDFSNITSIGGYAFRYSKLTSVDIPSTSSVGINSFSNCDYLVSVVLNGNVLNSSGAFSNCVNLTSVTLNNVTTIPDSTFTNCSSLSSIDLSGVTTLGNSAFSYTALSDIVIPNSVVSFGSYVFAHIPSLQQVIWDNDSVYTVPGYMFDYCTNLNTLELSDLIKNVSAGAFCGCNSLTHFDFSSIISIGAQAFCGVGFTGELSLPETLTSIGANAFNSEGEDEDIHYVNITKLIIDTNAPITSIGNYAFRNCINLTEIRLNSAIEELGNEAFAYCDLRSVDLTSTSMKTIKNGAFLGNSNLLDVLLPTSLTTVEQYAFRYCTKLEKIQFNSTIPPTLGPSAFTQTIDYGIFVPDARVSTYKSAAGFSNYASHIIELSYWNGYTVPNSVISQNPNPMTSGSSTTITITNTNSGVVIKYGYGSTSINNTYSAPFSVSSVVTIYARAIYGCYSSTVNYTVQVSGGGGDSE